MRHRTFQPRSLLTNLRAWSRVVAVWLIVCLFLQTTVSGLFVTSTSCGEETVDSCRMTGIGAGCCCGPSESGACNCCCSRKSDGNREASTTRRSTPTRDSVSVGPTFCGCQGKAQFGLFVASEPAVLTSPDQLLVRCTSSKIVANEQLYSFAGLAPPTPPPEFSV